VTFAVDSLYDGRDAELRPADGLRASVAVIVTATVQSALRL